MRRRNRQVGVYTTGVSRPPTLTHSDDLRIVAVWGNDIHLHAERQPIRRRVTVHPPEPWRVLTGRDEQCNRCVVIETPVGSLNIAIGPRLRRTTCLRCLLDLTSNPTGRA